MALSLHQQIIESLEKTKNILITFKKDYTGDDLAAALALQSFLKKINKPSTIAAADFFLPKKYSFLPNSSLIQASLKSLKKIVLNINLNQSKVEEFSYDVQPDKLQIFITPEEGDLDLNNIKTADSNYRFDLIITVGSPDLEALGDIYEKNPEFFYKTTIINIDVAPENENFGQINFINLNASSVCEVVYRFIEDYHKQLIDEEIATLLLVGIMEATQRFTSAKLYPATLTIASQLIAAGAKKEEIASNLYRTKNLPTLRLWGRVLARLQKDLEVRLVWSLLNEQDFLKSGAVENDLNGVVEELITSTPEAQVVVLLYEGGKKVNGQIFCQKNYDALILTKPFNAQGTKSRATFSLSDITLFEAERKVIEEIRNRLKNIK